MDSFYIQGQKTSHRRFNQDLLRLVLNNQETIKAKVGFGCQNFEDKARNKKA